MEGDTWSNVRREIVALVRTELAQEVAAGFPRLVRIPETDIIWFLDWFPTLDAVAREALLDGLAESAALMFFPPRPRTLLDARPVAPPVVPVLEAMRERRADIGSRSGTRYTDLKMLGVERALQDPARYHESVRPYLTPLHFQPRADLLVTPESLTAAKAPLLRKLVRAAFARDDGWTIEKQPGGVSKCVAQRGDTEIVVRIDFGGGMTQLGYTVTIRRADDRRPIAVQLTYERLWHASGRWDYISEANAPRCVPFLAEQVAYLADLVARIRSKRDALGDA